jgi:hypothetical protein
MIGAWSKRGIEMIGYDLDKKLYTFHAFTSLGEADAITSKMDWRSPAVH